MKQEINFDYNASAGLLPQVRTALFDIDLGLNPSSVHRGGQRSRALIENSRDEILCALGSNEDYELVFTSGATESNNTAMLSQFWDTAADRSTDEVVTLAVEHPSVLEPLRRLVRKGHKVHFVNPSSATWLEELLDRITERTALVSIMIANNETGRVFDLAAILPLVRARNPKVVIHSDLVQALGKMPINLATLDLDLASISGHKIGALSGTGALIVRRSTELHPLIVGGSQELKRRAGTENVMGIVSFGLAATFVTQSLVNRISRMSKYRDFVENSLLDTVSDVQILDRNQRRIANTSCLRIPGVMADDLIVALDLEGIQASSGAACSSGKPEPSHVLMSLGLNAREAKECLRISVDPSLDMEGVELACQKISESIMRFRSNLRVGNA